MKSIRILSLGDSYTYGEGVKPKERWPNQLSGLLERRGYIVQELRIIAKTGWTTGELSQAIIKAEITLTYDLVTLLIGVNNQYRGLPVYSYKNEFANLLNRSIVLAGSKSNHVLVLSIPDWSLTPFASNRDREKISKEIEMFNQVNREITKAAHSIYLDITPITRKVQMDPSLLTDDGLHPSGRMYDAWASRAFKSVLTML